MIGGFGRRTGLVWGLLAVVALGGCSHTYEKREVNYKDVAIDRAPGEVPDSQLIDVRIKSFKPAPISEDKDKSVGISKEVRKVEAYYAAVQLRRTMQETGYWGAVRVVPSDYTGGELLVAGSVLESDGEILRLDVTVTDATGTQWFDREYSGIVDSAAYDTAKKKGEDPFAFVYTKISNDIAQYRAKLQPAEVKNIREVAKLRFAADFAPDAFKGYVKEKPKKSDDGFFGGIFSGSNGASGDGAGGQGTGHYEVARLPAKGDPMMERVERVRVREDLVVDALDQEYESLARQVSDSYTQWRSSRLNEMNALRKVEEQRDTQVGQSVALAFVGILAGVAVGSSCRSCAGTGGAIAGAAAAIGLQNAIQASNQANADEKMHKAALEEIGQSLSSDVKPVVVQVEGQAVELRGSAEQKFSQWRSIMKRLYKQEVGPMKDLPGAAGPSDSAPDKTGGTDEKTAGTPKS